MPQSGPGQPLAFLFESGRGARVAAA